MDKTRKVALLRQMVLIRAIEREWTEFYNREEIDGTPPALSLGQEAVSVGLCAALEAGDFVFTSHRGEGPQVARGLDPKAILAELCGRRAGTNKGKANYHVSDFAKGVIGMGGIIGAQAPVATGMAMAQKMKQTDRVSVSIVGDGAVNEGPVWEAANLASVWKLPVIFVTENNGYCVTLPSEKGSGAPIAERGAAFGMPGEAVDGNDLMAMVDAASRAVARARAGQGPTWIEARTYRLSGHLAHDPQVYRSKEDIAAHWEQCPIKRWRERLEAEGVLSAADVAGLEQSVADEVAAAAAFVRASPLPAPAEAFDDLWA